VTARRHFQAHTSADARPRGGALRQLEAATDDFFSPPDDDPDDPDDELEELGELLVLLLDESLPEEPFLADSDDVLPAELSVLDPFESLPAPSLAAEVPCDPLRLSFR